uniref:BZIP domain-containing protein n=1 Tax=Kalanchoe fedtschenkoi TaxID=63787 RepID=A0A7N0VHR9_KALFE
MEDYYCWSNKSSGDTGNHRVEDLLHARNVAAELTPFAPSTGDSRLGLARSPPPVFKRPHVGSVRSDWTKAFLNQRYQTGSSDVGGAGLIGWTCSGRLPSIPEERELGNDGGGEGKKGKDEIILVKGDGGKRIVTATDELVKDLQAQFSLEELPDATRSAQLADDHDDPDYKRRRRLMLNRLSAQRSRQRKLQAVADKAEIVKMLEVEVEAMRPQINDHEERQKILRMENLMMKSRISALEKRAQLNTIEIEERQAEIRRLKEDLQAAEWMQQGAPHHQHQPLPAVPAPASQSTTATAASACEAGSSDGDGSRLPDIPMHEAEEEEEASSNADDTMEA